MSSAIDNANYYNDPRVRNAGRNKPPTLDGCEHCYQPEGCCDCTDEQFGSGKVELPTCWAVCPTCNGAGRHVNPSIDCNGLTADDFADDPDFADEYFGGTYDQTCSRCDGRTTISAPDYDAMSPELRERYETEAQAEADYDAERLAEIRAGC